MKKFIKVFEALTPRHIAAFLTAFLVFSTFSGTGAYAANSVNDVAESMVTSSEELPGLVSVMAYLLGLLLGVTGLLKLREHAESPNQTPLHVGIVRLIAGGALFALPTIYEAAQTSFGAGNTIFNPDMRLKSIELPGLNGQIGDSVNDIAENMVDSSNMLPQLIAVITYFIALLLGATGILKLREHAENPTQTPLRSGVIRLLICGALFALPVILNALVNAIGQSALNVDSGSIVASVAQFMGVLSFAFGNNDLNGILGNLIDSISDVPAFISALAYLLGLVISVIGLLKIREHVENPDQVHLKEGVVRLLIGGALFALPSVYNAMFGMYGQMGTGSNITSGVAALQIMDSTYAGSNCGAAMGQAATQWAQAAANWLTNAAAALGFGGGGGAAGGGPTMGTLICGILFHSGAVPAFLTGIAYLLGLVFGIWGIIKLRDHALEPQRTGLSEGVTRLVAGGAFFALPVLIEVLRNTVGTGAAGTASTALNMVTGGGTITGYNVAGACGGGAAAAGGAGGPLAAAGAAASAAWQNVQNAWNNVTSIFGGGGGGGGGGGAAGGGGPTGGIGLDCMLSNFMTDIMGPVHIVMNFFTFAAGLILLMIGISRLIKSAQDGARGPGGIGTITTFVVAGLLISYNDIMGAMSTSLFGSGQSLTFAKLTYANTMGAEAASAHTVISAILKFVILLGLVSFVRGLFIIRGVAEGNQQSSLMAGVTHIVAGAVAVNLGPLINAVQATLGITQYGILFS